MKKTSNVKKFVQFNEQRQIRPINEYFNEYTRYVSKFKKTMNGLNAYAEEVESIEPERIDPSGKGYDTIDNIHRFILEHPDSEKIFNICDYYLGNRTLEELARDERENKGETLTQKMKRLWRDL